MSKMVESLLKNIPANLLTEEVQKEVETQINEAVDARVEAKLEVAKEELTAKETELTESFALKESELKAELAENERVLVEEAEKFKSELELAVIEETKSYKDRIESELAEETATYRSEVEAMVLEEAKELKARQDVALVEEVKKFREEMVEKVSDYIEAQLSEAIPTEMMEAAAQLEVYKPLVESMQQAFASNFIKLDSSSYNLIKEARDENEALKNEIQALTKSEIKLKKDMKNVERNMKVESITEGLTAKQKSRATKLLEGVDLEDIETRFETIRDVVIEESVAAPAKTEAPAKKVEVLEESEAKVTKTKVVDEAESEVVQHQVKAVIKESVAKEEVAPKKNALPENASPMMEGWQKKLNKVRNRS